MIEEHQAFLPLQLCGEIHINITSNQIFVSLWPHSLVGHIGAACGAQGLQTGTLLRGASGQELCQAQTDDSSRLGEGAARDPGSRQDHCADDVSAALPPEHGTRPLALSALSGGDDAVADVASEVRGDL